MTGIKWKYIWPYLLFVGTILVAVAFNVFFIVSGIEQNNYHAQLINIAGKQRYLSQLNVSNLLLYERGTYNIKEATKNLSEWNDTHLSLQNRKIKSNYTEPDSSILNNIRVLNPVQEQLFKVIQKAYTNGLDSSSVPTAIKLQNEYFLAMDNLVFLFQRRAESSLQNIRQKQVWVAFFSGLILILEILLLIIPYHKKLIKAYDELKENKIIIEKQALEITNQVESISTQKNELEGLHQFTELTLAGINAGVWSWDINSGQEHWSPNFYHILG